MKKIIAGCILLFFISCNHQEKKLQFDDQGITLIDSVTIAPHDSYYQMQDKPTRGTTATIKIDNRNDTAKVFAVKIVEVK